MKVWIHWQTFLLALPIGTSSSSNTMRTSSISRICSSSKPCRSLSLVVRTLWELARLVLTSGKICDTLSAVTRSTFVCEIIPLMFEMRWVLCWVIERSEWGSASHESRGWWSLKRKSSPTYDRKTVKGERAWWLRFGLRADLLCTKFLSMIKTFNLLHNISTYKILVAAQRCYGSGADTSTGGSSGNEKQRYSTTG